MTRKQKKYHFIYKTTNLLSGKYYYGMHSTDDLEDGYLGSGKRLRYSLNKYGDKNHKREIIEFCDSREELKKREKEIVNLNEIAKQDCMNLTVGGHGGFNHLTDEQLKLGYHNGAKTTNKLMWVDNRDKYVNNLSKKKKEWWNSLDTELRVKLLTGINWYGKRHSEETKQKMSNAKKGMYIGENNPQYGSCWITKDGKNKKIKKEELPKYTQQGWVMGRKIK